MVESVASSPQCGAVSGLPRLPVATPARYKFLLWKNHRATKRDLYHCSEPGLEPGQQGDAPSQGHASAESAPKSECLVNSAPGGLAGLTLDGPVAIPPFLALLG